MSKLQAFADAMILKARHRPGRPVKQILLYEPPEGD